MQAREFNNTNTKKPEIETLKVNDFRVHRARAIENGIIMADLIINGITVYGMKVLANKKTGEAFLAFPQQKGKDGKYYSIVYAKLSDTDQEEMIRSIYNWLDAVK